MTTFFEPGSWVWIPDEDEVVLPALVKGGFRMGDKATVSLENGAVRHLSSKESAYCSACDPQSLDSRVDNLTVLDDLNENSLLNILRARFRRDHIYSNIGTILVSVNPFKSLPLYTPQQMDLYKEGPRGKPPHVFAVGHRAYYDMLSERKPQSVIITGESGAGKSEACKLVLQFIADLSAAHSGKTVSEDEQSLEQQLLQANPILESFGNAKTVRNDNSSRFGKLITIKFDPMGAISESSLVSYLLEKSRVVFQTQGERNYHIFYQLVAAAEENPKLRDRLQLDGCEAFMYLNQSGVTSIEGVVEEVDFDEVRNAMDTLMFTPRDKDTIWSVLAAVLHFGNISFGSGYNPDPDEDAVVGNPETLAFASKLVGCDPKSITRALTTRKLSTGGVVVPYKVDEAGHTRDAMTKTLYALMFEWIIKQINTTLEAGKADRGRPRPPVGGGGVLTDSIIALLDIFGFESFASNSFEQLCINYCNEKLNNHFNEHVFKGEIAAYADEGVVVPNLEFRDNKPILDFIERKGDGIFSILDEQIMVNGTDSKFLSKVQQLHARNKHYIMPKRNNCPDPDTRSCFGVVHFAGDVFYNVADFVEKNKDALHSDVVDALLTSTNPAILELFQPVAGKRAVKRDGSPLKRGSPPPASRKGTIATRFTISKQFKGQLDALMSTLNATDPHFIRCMKPNGEKAGDMFVTPMMLEQLRYSGLLEVCTIRKMGFPIRRVFDEFFVRYGAIFPSAKNMDHLLQIMEEEGHLDSKKYAKGHTKILMKNEQALALDMAREKVLEKHAVVLQRLARGFVVRRRLRFMREVLDGLRKAILKRSEPLLVKWFAQVNELPNNGQHMAVVQEAEALMRRLEQESKALALVQEAILRRDLNALNNAIGGCDHMRPPLRNPKVDEARDLKRLLEEEKRVTLALRSAVEHSNFDLVVSLLEKADKLNLDGEEVKQAKALKLRVEGENECRRALENAHHDRDLDALNMNLQKASELGLSGPAVEQAKVLQKELLVSHASLKALRTAVESRHMESVKTALSKCAATNITTGYDVEVAKTVLVELEREQHKITELQNMRQALKVATSTRSMEAIMEAIGKAESINFRGKELADAYEMKRELDEKDKVMAEIQTAMNTKDMDALGKALKEAERLNIDMEMEDYAELQEVRNTLNREEKVLEVKARLKEGVRGENLALINKALAMALELGCQDDTQVVAAQGVQKRLTTCEEARSKVLAAQRALTVKMQSKSGVTREDLDAMSESVDEAKTAGVSEASAFMVDASILNDRGEKQLEAQVLLTQALASLNKAKMREALEFAEEQELSLEMMGRARRALRRIEDAGGAGIMEGALSTMTEEDIEKFRMERDERHNKAANSRYKFQNYPRLRTPAEYSKGSYLHKKREQERMLEWQNTVSNKSLMDSKDLVRDAVTVRKSLLGYMGDKQMSFPETLAQNILMKGLDKPKIRDEIYLQIMKQLSNNPKPDSTAKGWQVMCMACSTFLPSMDFENYLLNFILEKCQIEGAEACYSKYCLHTLEGMMSSRTNEGIVPTLEEIQAYKERPPILATIELVNGALLTEDLPVAPDLNVKKVLEICAHFGGLQAARTEMMGLFVYDLGPIDEEKESQTLLPFTPSPLRNEDFMGDVFIRKARQRRDFKFVYKRKIFLHSHQWPSSDPAFNRLVYLQGEDDVIRSGILEITDKQSVVLLSAIAMAMDLQEDTAASDKQSLAMEVGRYIPPAWLQHTEVAEWASEVEKLWPDLITKDLQELEILFVEQCRDRPMYGSHFFYSNKVQCVPDLLSNLPSNLLLAFNADGMHIFSVDKKELLQQYSYADVHSWRGTRRQVSLTIWDQDTDSVFELALKTQQASDMASIILDHINAIMANSGRN